MVKIILYGMILVIISSLVLPTYAETIRISAGSANPRCQENNECFIPYHIEINKGSSATWINGDYASHTVTSGTAQNGTDGKFFSERIRAGGVFFHVFTTPGNFEYFCTIYPWMNGVITVKDSTDTKSSAENAGIQLLKNKKDSVIAKTPDTSENKTSIEPTKFLMNVDDKKIMLNYNITEGSIRDIYPDTKSLIIKIDTTKQGMLSITLPRDIIDAKLGDMDDSFYVLVDEEEVDFDEIATPIERTISVEFTENTEEIEIIGTFVIPEFGLVVLAVLLIGVISVIAISRSKIFVILQPRHIISL
ncbi:MAG: PEFG-CTERM sorting domain-containing protein [Nitrosopumilus sp.]|nr:PEFG-CTERM sorting domain-containing protein [Nitrosopumilus sp.]MDH3489544.1 PEFG-CTERM sorting domain-containing protein [Nitrosopumilus sp.]MDH3516542.1 PEFG-CTERM sorting domain-containing protein [Nitrosopumilus sp.]MDH3565008.1 PEFG-CTERM sorting domain-containing protein [Nitrosopumilus sp.]MDH5416431.1 PEFG-CTERM sorting domain-containing protein [Nitrosopumilus sp.]